MKHSGPPKLLRNITRGNAFLLLQECKKHRDAECCRYIESIMLQNRLDDVEVLVNHLIRLFALCGSLVEANQTFSKVAKPSDHTWGAIITAHAKHGHGDIAIELYNQMVLSGIKSKKHMAIATVQACTATLSLNQGRHIHDHAIETQLGSDDFFGNSLVDMYAKCGSLEEAQQVFDMLQNQDVVSWNSLIAGYAQQEYAVSALEFFNEMQHKSIKPNNVTFLATLKACGSIRAVEYGRHVHEQITENGFHSDTFVQSSMVDMYAKCGSLTEARKAFDNLPSGKLVLWNAIITGYAHNGKGLLALECFQMMEHENLMPDRVTFASILKACGGVGAIYQGRCVHEKINACGLKDLFVRNMLVDMYSKCGSLEEACHVFQNLWARDVVSWGAIIGGCTQHGEGLLALKYFDKMQQQGTLPNEVTFLSSLKACGDIWAIERGRQIHEQIIKSGFQFNVCVASALVDMYVSCGKLEEAQKVFDTLPARDTVSWNAMIAGHAQSANLELVVQSFEYMQQEGIRPNDVTFLTILVACSHAGLVDKGHKYFISMIDEYGIIPNISHYTCMIDLLGCAGHLKEAEHLLQIFQPDIIGWKALLSACRKYGNVDVGKRCFDQIVQLDPHYDTAYMLMSGVYSSACMWEDAANVEELRQHAGASMDLSMGYC